MERFNILEARREAIQLTAQETEILSLILEGLFSQEVADRLYISKHTVDFHLANIYQKLGVDNRLHAIHQAHRLGLLNAG